MYSIEVFSLIVRKSWILTVKFVAKLKLDYGNLNKIQFDEFAHEDNRHESYEITFSIFSKTYLSCTRSAIDFSRSVVMFLVVAVGREKSMADPVAKLWFSEDEGNVTWKIYFVQSCIKIRLTRE